MVDWPQRGFYHPLFYIMAYITSANALLLSPLKILVHSNCLSERIRVIEGEVEEVRCPDMVDVIISEPMGYMLLSGKLMGSFLHARKWLKPDGKNKT